jgi:hypothetical protein
VFCSSGNWNEREKTVDQENQKVITLRMPELLHRELKMLSGFHGKSTMHILFDWIEELFEASGLPNPR